MSRGTGDRHDWDQEFESVEEESDFDVDEEESFDEEDGPEGEDDEPTIACPYCDQPVYEDSPRCPHCERYISEEDLPPRRKPWWIVLGAVVCLYIAIRWIVG